jgi:FtsH-binding integral membrane protein
MVIYTMSTPPMRSAQTEVRITHPNRDKPVVQATRATVIVLMLATVALLLLITVGGWSALEGTGPIALQFVFIFLYLLLAFYAARWQRGVLPVAAALAVLLATFALVAAPGWFERTGSGFAQPALSSGLLGLLTLLVIPVQILLITFAMRGFSQGWNVERELRDSSGGAGGHREAAPHPA